MNKKIILLSLLFSGLSGWVSAHGSDWGYTQNDGPEKWGSLSFQYGLCASGMNQSPVNIADSAKVEVEVPLQINYRGNAHSIINNGHAVQVDVVGDNTIVVDNEPFKLIQFHFHTPGEHLIEGEAFPMSAHFVHSDAKGNLAVLGIKFTEGEVNPVLAEIMGDMMNVTRSPRKLKMVNMTRLLPEIKQYYRYSGSLTTPPCTEGVRWIVFKETVTASSEQIAAMQKAIGFENNRPPQPLNGRVVMY